MVKKASFDGESYSIVLPFYIVNGICHHLHHHNHSHLAFGCWVEEWFVRGAFHEPLFLKGKAFLLKHLVPCSVTQLTTTKPLLVTVFLPTLFGLSIKLESMGLINSMNHCHFMLLNEICHGLHRVLHFHFVSR